MITSGFDSEPDELRAIQINCDDQRRRQTLKNAERFIALELKTIEDKTLNAQEPALARQKVCTSTSWSS